MNHLVKTLLVSSFISIFIALPSHAEDVYKRIDEKGVPSFSDTQTEGAEIITVDPVNIQTIPLAPPPTSKPITSEASFNYTKLDIISPADQTTLRNEYKILLQTAIKPDLRTGHKIEFLDNGQPLQAASKNMTIELTSFERGNHTLTARIIDKSNKVIKTSSPVTIYVFRTAITPAPAPAP